MTLKTLEFSIIIIVIIILGMLFGEQVSGNWYFKKLFVLRCESVLVLCGRSLKVFKAVVVRDKRTEVT